MTITIRGHEFDRKGNACPLLHIVKTNEPDPAAIAWYLLKRYARLGVLGLSANIV